MRSRDKLLSLYSRHVNAGMGRIFRMSSSAMETRSAGCLVYDQHDVPYLDCGGYCVFLLGHCHPHVVDAVVAAARRHPLSTRLMFEGGVAEAAHALACLAPAGLEYVWFASSGAEAVEAALKLCRLNGRRAVVAADNGFHGKTLGALSVSGRPRYRDPFAPLLNGVTHVPFGDAGAVEARLAALPEPAAVIVEPVQSEAGVRIPPPGYLAGLRAACDRHDALLVLDEVSTGMGRLGTWWGADRETVAPDILIAGKALGGGVMPVSAMVARPEAFEPLNRDPTLHTSTFAGSPIAAAAVVASIEAARELDLPRIADVLGKALLAGIREIVARTAPWFVTGVRGCGLLLGIECAQEHHAGELVLELLGRRVVVAHSLNDHRVVRLTPPAVLSPDESAWLLDAIEHALTAVAIRWPDPEEGSRHRERSSA